MLTLEQTPDKVDMLYNSKDFVVKDSDALKYTFSQWAITLYIENFTFTETTHLFSISFPNNEIAPITFYLIDAGQENYDGITIRAHDGSLSLTDYTEKVVADLKKNFTLSKYYDISASVNNPGDIRFKAKYKGKKHMISIGNYNKSFSMGTYYPGPGNIDQELQAPDYHTLANIVLNSKTLQREKNPDSFDARNGFTHFKNENIIERIVAKDNRVAFTFPAPDEFDIIPKYTGLISYKASFTVFYNDQQQKSIDDETRYIAAGGVSNIIRNLLDNQNKSFFDYKNGQFLTNLPDNIIISTNAPIRLYFATIPPAGASYTSNHKAVIDILFTDGTESVFGGSFTHIPAYSLGEVICGYNELNMAEKYTKQILKYSVRVENSAGDIVAAPKTFYPRVYHYDTTSFAFYNSFGVPEIITFSGKRDEGESAEIPEYDSDNPKGQITPYELKISGDVASGFLHYVEENPENTINWLNDFARSKEVHLLDDGGFLPVKITDVDTSKKEMGLLSASISFELKETSIYSKGKDTAFIEPPPPPEPEEKPVLLLEDGTGGILLEDGGYIFLEDIY